MFFTLVIYANNIGRGRIKRQKVGIKRDFSVKPALAFTYKASEGVK